MRIAPRIIPVNEIIPENGIRPVSGISMFLANMYCIVGYCININMILSCQPKQHSGKKKNVTTFGLLVPFWCDFILFMISKLINWNKQQNRTRCTWMICDDDKFPIHWVGQLAPTLCSNVHPLFTCHQIQHHETIQSKSKKKKPCATKIDLIQSKTCTLDQRNPMSTTINFQIATENVVLLRFPNNWE